LLLIAACSKSKSPLPAQITVLRFENLTGNPALDWMERGAARQITAQLGAASTADSPLATEERQAAVASGVTRFLHGYVSRAGDRLRLHADLEDTALRKIAKSAEAIGAVSAGLLPLTDAVARQLDPGASAAGAKSEPALAAFVAGLNATEAPAAIESLERAIAADPDFGPAYLTLIQLSLSRQDRVGAERYLAAARARGGAISALDRARLDVDAAQVAGNPAALSQAMAALARLTPSDLSLLRNAANTELAAKRYAPAVEYFKKALAIAPGDPTLLNALGYTHAYQGDLDSAVQSLREYERVRPQEANPLDSLAEVHFYLGRFPESEKLYRQAYEKDPAFLNSGPLMRSALARLMTGDSSGAETIFADYEAARRAAHDPVIDMTRARWDYLRGERTAAIGKLKSFAAATRVREAAGIADCTLTVWLLNAGDPASAAQHPACRFLTDKNATSFPNPMMRAYALLFNKDFEQASALLREIIGRAAPSPTDPAPVLLAWALVETGHFDEAEKYLQTNPTPAALLPDPFESAVYPRIFHLRAIVAEKKGARAEAEQNARVYLKLSKP
jgi:tetratricopeptide (TPR) repeat protein